MSKRRPDRVTEYAERVAGGEVPSGRLHRLACERHLRDMDRQGTEEFPYTWDACAAQNVLDYAEALTVVEGFRRKPVKLMDCQAFDIGCTFGWKNDEGFRRFRRRYKSISRQQGKSFENGILGTYIAAFAGYAHGQLYTAATKRRQANIVWQEMAKFIQGDDDLAEFFKIQEYKNLITALKTRCTIESLSKESGLDDGFRPIFASLDELHQMKDNGVYRALWNGTRDLDETLISMITTRGKSVDTFAYQMDSDAQIVLEGSVSDESFFVDIYALDEEDDPFDESVWFKAAPRLVSTEKGMKRLREDAAAAKRMGGMELKDFLCKGLNVWVERGADAFVAPQDWNACATDATLRDYTGSPVWIGIDLSSGGDLTTVSFETEGNDGKTYIHSHSFMPRGRLEEHVNTDVAPYDKWHADGLLTCTGGPSDYRVDYGFVIRYIQDVVLEYALQPQCIAYDPHNADAFIRDLEPFGAPLLKVTQSAKNLNDATEDMRLLVKSGKVAFDRRNELLTWSMLNATLVANSFGEVKVDKKPGRVRRIDPVDACIDAHFAHMAQKEAEPVDFNQEMSDYLAAMGWA